MGFPQCGSRRRGTIAWKTKWAASVRIACEMELGGVAEPGRTWLSASRAVRGEKTEAVRQAISGFRVPFHITELQQHCPSVSMDGGVGMPKIGFVEL